MSNLKVSQLPEQTVISPVDFLYLISSGSSKRVHVNTLRAWSTQDVASMITGKQDVLTTGDGLTIVGNQIRLTDPVTDPLDLYISASS